MATSYDRHRYTAASAQVSLASLYQLQQLFQLADLTSSIRQCCFVLVAYSIQEEAKIACHIFKPLLEKDPNNLDLIYYLAHARYLLSQFEKAKPLLSRLCHGDRGAVTQ